MAKSTAWDATAYHDVAGVQLRWGRELVETHNWRGNERVLDAGCGTGRLADEILTRHLDVHLVAVDVDPGMVTQARRTLKRHEHRAQVLEGDVTSLPVDGPYDLVVSNAVLHWVGDHMQAYREFHRVLRPGGRLLAGFGGKGNLQGVHDIARQVLAEAPFAGNAAALDVRWEYEDKASTAAYLEAAGFTGIDVQLEPVPVTFDDDGAWKRFLQVVTLRSCLRALPQRLHKAYLDRYMELAHENGLARRLDFKRLYVDARRPSP